MKKRWLASMLLLPLVLSPGCGGGPGGLVKGKGRLTLDGEPVARAEVVFFPELDNGMAANATTDAEGRFALSTNDFPGVRPGGYKVLVSKREMLGGNELSGDQEKKGGSPGVAKMNMAGKSRTLLPPIYS